MGELFIMVQNDASKKEQRALAGSYSSSHSTGDPYFQQIEDERKTLMQELESEKRKFIDVFERAPAFMAMLRGKSHIFEMVNTAYYQLVGHRDIIGKPLLEAIPEVLEQGYIELLDTVLTTGEPFTGTEMKIDLQRVPNGVVEERYVNFVYEPLKDIKNNLVGVVAHGYDVTDQVVARQKAEQLALQIEQQAQTFDTTLTALKDFVYTFDTRGRFTYANRPLLELLGITLDEIIGKNFHELPYPEELATVLQAQIEQVVVTGKVVTDETPYNSPTGVVGFYEYIFAPVFDSDKHVILVAGSTRDITVRKQLESQKDDFMGIVSHELKTPVTSIKAFTQVLQSRFSRAGDEKSTALLGKMDAQINKLTSLIEDLLDATKIEGGKLQFNEVYFPFDELVSEIIEELQRTTNRHVIEKVGSMNKTVFGDKDRIGQVISNMLTNAIKYSPRSEKIIVKTMGDKETVTLCVQDFGVGIPKERQRQVFERFYRVSGNETIPGIGLGLYISAEIIRRQHGNIWVESEQGKGSTFCFCLPVRTQEIQ
jgi:two-component system, OmpR family, phosphate regulon sensor histidine kinase PhoR